jgi:hypothetical protein
MAFVFWGVGALSHLLRRPTPRASAKSKGGTDAQKNRHSRAITHGREVLFALKNMQ